MFFILLYIPVFAYYSVNIVKILRFHDPYGGEEVLGKERGERTEREAVVVRTRTAALHDVT